MRLNVTYEYNSTEIGIKRITRKISQKCSTMTRGDIVVFLILYLFKPIYLEDLDTYGLDWVIFNDEKGIPHFVDMKFSLPATDIMESTRRLGKANKPKFWHYTREKINDPELIPFPPQGDVNIIPRAPLIVLVAGWLTSRDGNATQLIKNAMLKKRKNINVIIMDWYEMQSKSYLYSAKITSSVAEILKDFVLYISKLRKVDGSNIHLIGHSLGAHVVGLAGEKLSKHNIIVGRVTGLDPRPFFELPILFPGLSRSSAAFVDIIHTSAALLGIYHPVGHADFYPGGGIYQPVFCPTWSIVGTCEHSSAYQYFAESLTYKFKARKCIDYFIYKLGLCEHNEIQYMGYPSNSTARGTYYLDVEHIPP